MTDEQNKKDEKQPQTVIPTEDNNVIASEVKQSPNKQHKAEVKHGFFKKKECKDCEKMRKECAEYKSGWQRAVADYKNLQKETTARMGEWAQMSERLILEEFIPVYDNFKKAFSACLPLAEGENQRGSESIAEIKKLENWRQGISYIMKQFGEVMKAHNVEEIKTAGEKFDPRLHETVGEETAEGQEQGVILKEIDGGYKMGGKVIKAAKVIISK